MTGKARYEVPVGVRIRYEAFRERMRQRRKELGLTQAQVAERMGRSQDFVSVLENQSSVINLITAMVWADALEIDVLLPFPERTADDDQEGEPALPDVDASWAGQELRRW